MRSECLGGGDADLRADVLIDAAIGLAGDGGADGVVDGKNLVAFALGLAEGAEGVDGFAGLADDEEEGVSVERGVAVTELGGVFDFDGNAGEAFDELLGDEAGMPGGAAAAEDEAVDLAELDGGEVEAAELGGGAVGGEAAAHGVFERDGLLENFLLHIVRVGADLGGFGCPGDFIDDGGDVFLGLRDDGEVFPGEVDEFAVF